MRICNVVLLASGLVLVAPAVEASFHLMSIREVYAGSVAKPDSQYVVLQMRSAGQNFVEGHALDYFDASGTPLANGASHFVFDHDVVGSDNQDFILVATPAAAAEFGVTPDFTMDPVLDRRGGRVCFDTFDCFAWGTYGGPPTRCGGPSSGADLCRTGHPFRATERLAPGRAARRNISAGNPDLLEPPDNDVSSTGAAGDDTGSSARDFRYAPDPRPITNAGEFPVPPPMGKAFNLSDFSNVSSLLLSKRGPKAQGGVLRLTPSETAPVRSSVWRRLRQPVGRGIDTTFEFRITPTTADSEGFAFVIQNESNSSLGGRGQLLGYQAITNGIAVEFDTRRSGDEPAGNRIGIHTRGRAANSADETASVAISNALPSLDDGAVHTARIRYTPGSPAGTLAVFLDGVNVVQANVALEKKLDLTRNGAFVGFTSGSGQGVGDHDILSWKFKAQP